MRLLKRMFSLLPKQVPVRQQHSDAAQWNVRQSPEYSNTVSYGPRICLTNERALMRAAAKKTHKKGRDKMEKKRQKEIRFISFLLPYFPELMRFYLFCVSCVRVCVGIWGGIHSSATAR